MPTTGIDPVLPPLGVDSVSPLPCADSGCAEIPPVRSYKSSGAYHDATSPSSAETLRCGLTKISHAQDRLDSSACDDGDLASYLVGMHHTRSYTRMYTCEVASSICADLRPASVDVAFADGVGIMKYNNESTRSINNSSRALPSDHGASQATDFPILETKHPNERFTSPDPKHVQQASHFDRTPARAAPKNGGHGQM